MQRLLVVLALFIPLAAAAQMNMQQSAKEPGYSIPGSTEPNRPPVQGAHFRGEVEGVDKVSGTISLKHGPISTLGVQGGIKEYEVKDSALLDQVKVGDKVRFGAVLKGRSLVVTDIAPAN